MSKKRFIIIGTALTLLLPNASFSEVIISNNRHSVLYVSGQYKPGISHFRKFSVKETNAPTIQLVGLKHDVTSIKKTINTSTNFNVPYKVTFQNDIISFSGAIGYSSSKGPRVELEGSYEEFDVIDPGDYLIKDAHRYFAVPRAMNDSIPTTPNDKKFTVMRNDGISIASVMFNGCYDIPLSKLGMSPYICAGIGGDFIEFFDVLHIKPAYQGKIGINYSLFVKANLFIDGYYHKVIGKQFNNLSVQHVVTLKTLTTEAGDAEVSAKTDPTTAYAVAILNVGYFGGEIGMRFMF